MSEIRRRVVAAAVIIFWLAGGYIFASEPKTFESGETQNSLIELFTSRQQRYAAAWGGDSVYTPGFVVNGKEWRGWFGGNAMPITSTKVGVLHMSVGDDGKVSATFAPDTMQARPLALNVALLGNDLESDVKRGENSGRKLRHDFVVLRLAKTDLTNRGNVWTGTVLLSSNAGTDKATALAAWVKSGETAPPIQATGGWLNSPAR